MDEQYLLKCEILQNRDAYIFDGGVIKISEHYLNLALSSDGHLDVYFGPFLLNKFSFEASLWFNHFIDPIQAM